MLRWRSWPTSRGPWWPVLFVSLLLPGVLKESRAAGSDFCGELREFYQLQLLALETELVLLEREKGLDAQEVAELSALREQRDRLTLRVETCGEYEQRRQEAREDRPARPKEPVSGGRPPTRREIDRLIREWARRYRVNPDLVRAIVKAESGYDVYARSRAGAMGLMQLMPETARQMGVDPWHPGENVQGGVRYLNLLLREFKDPRKALIGYNAGPEYVRRGWQVPAETRRYVREVLSNVKAYQETRRVRKGAR